MEPNIKKILITGANGFIGREVAKHLARQGYQLTAIVRKIIWQHSNINFVCGDLKNIDQLGIVAEEFDSVVHLASFVGMHERGGRLFQGTYQLTEKILDFFSAAKPYFIYFSSIEAFGPTGRKEIVENDSPSPITDYGKVKLKTEELVKNYGLPYSVLRLGNVVGDEAGLLFCLRQILQGNGLYSKLQTFFLKNVFYDYELNFINLEDICRVVDKIVKNKPNNQLYFVTNQRTAIEKVYGRPKKGYKFLLTPALIGCKLILLLKLSHIICYLTEGGLKRRCRNYSNKKLISDLQIDFKDII